MLALSRHRLDQLEEALLEGLVYSMKNRAKDRQMWRGIIRDQIDLIRVVRAAHELLQELPP